MARKLTAWNIFVQKIGKENPGKPFKEILKLASTLKNQGKIGNNVTGKKGKKSKKSKKAKKSRRR